MLRNKFIILPFLLTAWTIIFVHSIIPHHHHSDDLFSECAQCHLHEHFFSDNSQIWDHDADSKQHVCNFEVEAFTQVSIDHIFIVNTENRFLDSVSNSKTDHTDYYSEFVSEQTPTTHFLRGPPNGSFFLG